MSVNRKSFRMGRVGSQIRGILAESIQHKLTDPRLVGLSVTGVEVTRDLRYAKVYFYLLDDSSSPEDALEGLSSASNRLRRELARRLRAKHIPELSFVHDRSIDHGRRIEELLAEINDEESNRSESTD